MNFILINILIRKNNAPNSEMAAESFCDPCIVLIASVRTDFSMNHCYSENVIVILSKCLNKVHYLFLNMYLRFNVVFSLHFNGNSLTSH